MAILGPYQGDLPPRGHEATATAAEMFETAQWAQASQAAASLAQMAARSAKGSPQLAGVVRERQDLVSEWQTKDKLLIAAKGAAPANHQGEAETVLAGRLAAIDKRLAEIDRRFARDFPDYAALASPAPCRVAEVQAQLRADEALVLFLDMPAARRVPEESFIWVVTKSDVRWVRSGLGTAALGREVAALRCGLDETAWVGEGAERCANALRHGYAGAQHTQSAALRSRPCPQALHEPVRGGAGPHQGKHLLIVPSGPLTQLPFQVLVTEAPSGSRRRRVARALACRQHPAGRQLAESAASGRQAQHRPSADDRLR